MIQRIVTLIGCTRGATAIEYGLIATLIALAALSAMTLMSDKVIGIWNNTANEVSESSSS